MDLLSESARTARIRLLAYCLLDNHYHLVFQNTSGGMSLFFKLLNGQYGNHYRKDRKERGAVFQDRYKSRLIQDETYLLMAISYVLGNPVQAGIVDNYREYPWSSGGEYFSNQKSSITDREWVEDLFGTRDQLARLVTDFTGMDKLPTVRTEMGSIIGEKEFAHLARKKGNRRSGRDSLERRRKRDIYFEPVEKIYREFERMHSIQIEKLDIHSISGKRWRSRLLVHLKERGGLTYRQIAQLDVFCNLSIQSLGTIYRRFKQEAR